MTYRRPHGWMVSWEDALCREKLSFQFSTLGPLTALQPKYSPSPKPFSKELNRHSLATHKQGRCRYHLLYLPCESNSFVCPLPNLSGQAGAFLARDSVVSNPTQPQCNCALPGPQSSHLWSKGFHLSLLKALSIMVACLVEKPGFKSYLWHLLLVWPGLNVRLCAVT